jgi:ABC-type sugar transport system permease subunit
MYPKSNRLAPYLFILPNILVVLLFAIYPLVSNLIISFSGGNILSPTFIGFDNYTHLFQDESFWISLKGTVYYTLLVVPVTTGLSLILAIGLNRTIPLRNFLRASYLLPHLISWSVVGLIWKWMYSPTYGIFNHLLELVKLTPSRWLLDPLLTIPCLAFTGIWAGIGYYMVIFLAGLQGIPSTYYEAAKIDGANSWQQFRDITLPALKPITSLVMILSMISSFRVFEQIYVMTGGGPGRASFVMVLYIFIKGFEEFNIGYAATLSIMLFLILMLFTILQQRLFGNKEN